MRFRIPKVILLTGAVLAVAAASGIHQELLNVPRIRVGPLRSEVPAKPTMRFFALGDTGTGGDTQLAVAKAMEQRCREHGADAIFLLGDNAYPVGFNSVEDPQWQTKVLDPYGSPCLESLPIYAVLGNHDYKENPAAEIEYTLINPRWHMPNRFYSVSFGKLLKVVALDTNISDLCFNPAFCGLDFLMNSIKQEDTTWTFVMAHHPVASSSDHGFAYRGGIRGLLLKPYLCNRIDLYLSGHSHHLEARQPKDCRMAMYVAGGGGGDLYKTVDPDAEVAFARSENGFVELEVTDQLLTARLIDKSAQVVYEATKTPTPHTATGS